MATLKWWPELAQASGRWSSPTRSAHRLAHTPFRFPVMGAIFYPAWHIVEMRWRMAIRHWCVEGVKPTDAHEKVHQPHLRSGHDGMFRGACDRGGAHASSCASPCRNAPSTADPTGGPDLRRLRGWDKV